MSLLSMGAQAAAQAAAEAAARATMKKGKTDEQKKVIDFMYRVGGGCLGKGSKMTMEEYLNLVQQKCQSLNLQARALQKIGVDYSQVQEIQPVVLSSFAYDDDCLIRVDDNMAVSNRYSITWIFFGREQMFTYKYTFETTSDNTWESTKDFFYTDITAFSTLTQVKEKIEIKINKGCKGCLSPETVTKRHYVVDSLEIVVPGTSYAFFVRNSNTIQQSIMAAKAMLREKKYSR